MSDIRRNDLRSQTNFTPLEINNKKTDTFFSNFLNLGKFYNVDLLKASVTQGTAR